MKFETSDRIKGAKAPPPKKVKAIEDGEKPVEKEKKVVQKAISESQLAKLEKLKDTKKVLQLTLQQLLVTQLVIH